MGSVESAKMGKCCSWRNCSGVATPKLHPPPGMDGDGAAMAPPQVAPPVVRPLPPGQALYRRNESMHAAQMERTRAVLEVKAARAADPNAFLPRINKASRALAKAADERQGVTESYADQPWHNRLYDRSRKVYVADAYVEMGFEQLSVAEKAYLRNEQIERERGWVALGGKSSARVALTMPMPPTARAEPTPRTTSSRGGQRAGAADTAQDTFAPYSAILSRLSLPRGHPPGPPTLHEPTIDVPPVDPGSAQQAFSHYGAGAAVWMHSSNDILATLQWHPPAVGVASMVLQYQVEYRSRIRTDLLTTTEHKLNEFVSKHVGQGPAAAGSEPSGPWQELMTVDGHTTGVRVPNLLPYMSYEFRVKAANVNGFGALAPSARSLPCALRRPST